MGEFNPQKHICKFYFMKTEHLRDGAYRQSVSADLYLKELKIEIIDAHEKVVDVFGYSLEDKINDLLPLVEWKDYEKNRDISGWDMHNDWGYRDGWGYDFLCSNESGNSLIRAHLDVTFAEKYKPAYERLLEWVYYNFGKGNKDLKKYKIWWGVD